MRARTAIWVLAFSLAGAAAAGAADVRVGNGGSYGYGGFYAGDARADQLVIFDVEPGVVVRPYWISPWQNRHYFPRTGKKPRVGRRENLAERGVYKPAQTYSRYWSTVSYGADPWRGPHREFGIAPAPRREPLLK